MLWSSCCLVCVFLCNCFKSLCFSLDHSIRLSLWIFNLFLEWFIFVFFCWFCHVYPSVDLTCTYCKLQEILLYKAPVRIEIAQHKNAASKNKKVWTTTSTNKEIGKEKRCFGTSAKEITKLTFSKLVRLTTFHWNHQHKQIHFGSLSIEHNEKLKAIEIVKRWTLYCSLVGVLLNL